MDLVATIKIALPLAAVLCAGCSNTESGPASVKETSAARAELADRIQFLENYVTFRRQYEQLDYDIMYQNNGGGMLPGPSDWDIRLIAVVPESEIEAWVPKDAEKKINVSPTWLQDLPGTIERDGIAEWYRSSGRVIGIDINPHCKDLEEEQITICIGNQSDRLFLRDVASRFGPFEIVLDDGGHKMHEQIITFEELYPHISNNGIYFCEDLHTSYWKKYGGGFRRGESFIEFAKGLIDKLNAWHSEDERLQPDDLTETMAGLHFYDSVLVIEKELREKPFHKKRGREGW